MYHSVVKVKKKIVGFSFTKFSFKVKFTILYAKQVQVMPMQQGRSQPFLDGQATVQACN